MGVEDQTSLSIKDLPAHERPQQRLEVYGEQALSTTELLAIVISTGHSNENALQVAARLFSSFGSLEELTKAAPDEIRQVKGIGKVKAARVKSALELGRRLHQPNRQERFRITCPADAAHLLMPSMKFLEQEHLVSVAMNTRNEVLRRQTVYTGSVNSAVVRLAEVLRPAIRLNAPCVLVAHNHPSGDPTPSREDVSVTREMVKAGDLLGIEVLDHIIIGRDIFVSMKERGLGFD